MKKLKIILLGILFMCCYTSDAKEYTVRVTYYSASEGGRKVAYSKVPRAKEGVTIAAHPNFKFGTKVYIPDLKGVIGTGNFIVQDRGPDVTKKKASKGKAYVFDVYVTTRSNVSKCSRTNREYMKIYTYE